HTTQQYSITVSGVNLPPVFDALPQSFQGQEGQSLTVSIHAADAENDPLVYWADNLPPGAVFDGSSQTLTWLPGPKQAGTYPNVVFFASDGLNQVNESTTLVIAPTVLPPTLVRPTDRTILEGESLHIPLLASDPQGLPLTYSSASLPGGSFLDPNTGVF